MRKRIALLFGLMAMASINVCAADFETATNAVKNMGLGWNLGNTLDANSGSAQGLESETYWGQPVTKPELMKMMKEAGFSAIRVPVTWYNHMDANGKVDEAWMKRVHEIVDYVINQGLYCIVNVHHDTSNGCMPARQSTTVTRQSSNTCGGRLLRNSKTTTRNCFLKLTMRCLTTITSGTSLKPRMAIRPSIAMPIAL